MIDGAATALLRLRPRKNTWAHCGHLGPRSGACDSGQQIAAKGWAGLQQQALLIERQLGAVGRQAAGKLPGHPRRHLASQIGSPKEHRLGLELLDDLSHRLPDSCSIGDGEGGILQHQHLIGTGIYKRRITSGALASRLQPGDHQHAQRAAALVCQVASHPHQLIGHRQRSCALIGLSHHHHAAPRGEVGRSARSLAADGAFGARIDAQAAGYAILGNGSAAVLHLNAVVGAHPHTEAAAYAQILIYPNGCHGI